MANTNPQSSGKLTPHLDEESTKLLNLTVLQRIDPSIQQILITAAHVTFYDFNLNLNQWSRKDVEGSLFVVKRNGQPRFQFIVMNRRNTENLVEDLLGDFEYEVQHPYLLYRNAAQEVNGIWFYNPQECDEVAHIFRRVLGAYAKSPPKLQVTPSKSEYEELEVVQTSDVIEGTVEPSYPSSAARDLPEDSSFVNFFSSAMNIGNNTSSNGIPGQIYQASALAVPTSSNPPSVVQSQTPMVKASTLPMSTPSAPSFYSHDTSETVPSNRAELVKPSSFFVPTYSPTALAPPTSSTANASSHPHLDMQRSFTPLLQPFPPPTPPPSLTPNPAPAPAPASAPSYIPLTRQKVREALITLVQDDQFIDMVTQALQKVHQP